MKKEDLRGPLTFITHLKPTNLTNFSLQSGMQNGTISMNVSCLNYTEHQVLLLFWGQIECVGALY